MSCCGNNDGGCQCSDNLKSVCMKSFSFSLVENLFHYGDVREEADKDIEKLEKKYGTDMSEIMIDFLSYFIGNFLYEYFIVSKLDNQINAINQRVYDCGSNEVSYCSCKLLRDLFILIFRQFIKMLAKKTINWKTILRDMASISMINLGQMLLKNKKLKAKYEQFMNKRGMASIDIINIPSSTLSKSLI